MLDLKPSYPAYVPNMSQQQRLELAIITVLENLTEENLD